MTVTTSQFETLSDLLRDNAGIVLAPGKEYLVESRLSGLAQKRGVESMEVILEELVNRPSAGLVEAVIDAMTTNETSFFREMHVFQGLRNIVLPDIIERNGDTKSLRMWCGASSSGQEPFSVSLALTDWFPQLNDWSVNFVATDISPEMLDRCKEASFSQLEVNRGLPAPMLVKYFERNGTAWNLKEKVRRRVQFQKLNLLGDWSQVPLKLDIVFLRNVLIYFDVETKKTILSRIRKLLKPGGYLFLGSAETTISLDKNFENVKFARGFCYRHIEKD